MLPITQARRHYYTIVPAAQTPSYHLQTLPNFFSQANPRILTAQQHHLPYAPQGMTTSVAAHSPQHVPAPYSPQLTVNTYGQAIFSHSPQNTVPTSRRGMLTHAITQANAQSYTTVTSGTPQATVNQQTSLRSDSTSRQQIYPHYSNNHTGGTATPGNYPQAQRSHPYNTHHPTAGGGVPAAPPPNLQSAPPSLEQYQELKRELEAWIDHMGVHEVFGVPHIAEQVIERILHAYFHHSERLDLSSCYCISIPPCIENAHALEAPEPSQQSATTTTLGVRQTTQHNNAKPAPHLP